MNANEPLYVGCHKGVFTLPDSIYKSLASFVTNGFVYLRQDPDALTISTERITDGYRRTLQSRFRAQMFRDATQLAIVNLKASIRVIAVN